MPSISVHGASVFYRRHPAREAGEAGDVPLLLVHGAGGKLTHWPPHLRRLPGRTVIAPDLPGHGQSTGGGLASIAEYGTWLVALLMRCTSIARRWPVTPWAAPSCWMWPGASRRRWRRWRCWPPGPRCASAGVAGRVAQRLRRDHGAHRPAGLCTHRRR
ncbi:MAG: hypothetical protein R2851_14770 [Caldilineaceae bacterium]